MRICIRISDYQRYSKERFNDTHLLLTERKNNKLSEVCPSVHKCKREVYIPRPFLLASTDTPRNQKEQRILLLGNY
jgi:hypothetical protein